MKSDVLRVSEVFGPTIQGEGPSSGRRAAFVRLGECNLDCTWCDTPYTWDWSGKNGTAYDRARELREFPILEVRDWCARIGAGLVVITGGEPLLQQDAVATLTRELHEIGMEVEIETNGTIIPHRPLLEAWPRFNVSPKLSNSGVALKKRAKGDALAALRDSGAASFKFVCGDLDDLDEVQALVVGLSLDPRSVWIMPQGTSRYEIDTLYRLLAEDVIERGWNLTSRLHVLLWEGRRGV